ncbi:CASP-like protein 1D1 [Elaeis guineensis]|uniref:CASP-like protein n=1 Tax=Elaeis guineensis var. tenera TaxID=51953 RepID=A0A6I9Q8Q0_ELAGV|nr:CASP-like protein 1D1 [Elaeis guineensis]
METVETTEVTTTTTTSSGKTIPESGYVPPSPPPNFFALDFALRLLLLAATVAALVVLVTSKQTIRVATNLPQPFSFATRSAYFKNSPALIYLLVALSVGVLYSIITILSSCFAISRPSPSPKLYFHLIVFDALMAGILASATGTAGSIAYLGLKGNSHIGWTKVCNVYGKFCRHIGSSTIVTLVASIVLVLLVVLSSYSLYRRSH